VLKVYLGNKKQILEVRREFQGLNLILEEKRKF